MFQKRVVLMAVAAAGIGVASQANAALVNPANNDFEGDAGAFVQPVSDWTNAGNVGSVAGATGTNYPAGTQAAVIFNGVGSLEGGIGTVDAGSTTYALGFQSGQNILGGAVDTEDTGDGLIDIAIVEILVAGNVVATYDAIPGIPDQTPDPDSSVSVDDGFNFTLDTADAGINAGDAVSVRFSADTPAGQWTFDDVTVGVVPEPGSLALLGLGGLLIARRRRA